MQRISTIHVLGKFVPEMKNFQCSFTFKRTPCNINGMETNEKETHEPGFNKINALLFLSLSLSFALDISEFIILGNLT